MEQTALRPKSMPGSGGRRTSPGTPGAGPEGPGGPSTARRRGRRVCGALCGLLCAVLLVLAGLGLGTMGATVIGMGTLADLKRQTPPQEQQPAPQQPSGAASTAPAPEPAPTAGPTKAPVTPLVGRGGLGVEVVDAPKGSGALVVAVHVPGPGYTGGLVRGDVLVGLGGERVGSALDLAATVADAAEARPGRQVVVTVRHANGELQKLAVTPGVVT
ncbi:S1C family serine protease [Streptomyces sp. NPDC006422]|uniref:S1C family serine protease n=1 Tax=unclassified Streptomyces TaxID=2593676 RepID=UPI00339DFF0E